MSEETANALDIIRQQGKRHQQIMEQFESGSQHEAKYNYERWIKKTEELLKQYVSVEEAERFSEVVNQPYNIFRYGKGFELVHHYDSVQAFLLGLMRGIVENNIEVNPAALQSKRKLVLHKLYALAPEQKMGFVEVSVIAEALEMAFDEVRDVFRYWESKHFVEMTHEVDAQYELVKLTRQGIDSLELPPDKNTSPSTNITYHNTVHVGGNITGPFQQGTKDSVQNTSLVNESIREMLPKLGEFIEAVKALDFPDKEDAVRDLEKVKELSSGENPESKWKLIQAKLTSAKTVMELSGYAYTALPYGVAVFDYFFK
jgi:hypothetical protein